jgi:uncharacterized RDD family membrane protein YckC
MVVVMNAIAHARPAPVSGSKLDNRRVAAAILDLLIVAAGAALILFAGDALTGDRGAVRGALGFVILGWALYYFFATESGDGQTVGKKLMKLRVVRADGRPAGMAEIAVRTILRVVDNYLVGLIVMLATGERRQRIGDLAASTIVVDASATAVATPAPVTDVAEDAEGDQPEAEADSGEPVATQTITLPARPEPPATVADLSEEPSVEAEPVEDEPVAEEPVVEDEPVAEEPAVEDEPVEDEPAAAQVSIEIEPSLEDEDLPAAMSPSLEELAQDVAAAHAEPEVEEAPVEEEAAEDDGSDLPDDDGPVGVKSVETVSAIDLVMGGVSEDDSSEDSSESAQDPEEPASA